MERKYSTLKKILLFLHFFSGVFALLFILIFIKSGKHAWMYKLSLLTYIISGVAILTIFFKVLKPVQKVYFELVLLAPLLTMAFWIATRLFERLFFG